MSKKIIPSIMIMVLLLFITITTAGCQSEFINPGDNLGGGQEAETIPEESADTTIPEIIETTEPTDEDPSTEIKLTLDGNEVEITEEKLEISNNGEYVISGNINLGNSQIKVNSDLTDVVIYLNGATITKDTDKKAINAKSSVTIVIVANTKNSITTTYEGADAIGSDVDLTIMGSGELTISANDDCINVAKNLRISDSTINVTSALGSALKAEAITIKNATIVANTTTKDAIHAEYDYDDLEVAPTLDMSSGFVYITSSNITIETLGGDGIQADTFVRIVSGEFNIITNNGAPATITEYSSDNGEGKGIKAGSIDWGINDEDLVSKEYTIYIEGGTFNLNTNDDALHSDGYLFISGGDITISSGDDGVHAEELLKITGGTITVNKSYEGLEGAKVEISDGNITVNSTDDGINAADGTDNRFGVSNTNCYIIISGGKIIVNANGDGIDSNGTVLIKGGEVFVHGPTSNGNGSLDSDGGIVVDGGVLVAVGPLGMVETPTTTSKQYIVSFASNTSLVSGSVITLLSASGDVIVELTTIKSCASIIISAPDLVNGESYELYCGSTKLATFTISSKITSIGSSLSPNNPGGRPPRR